LLRIGTVVAEGVVRASLQSSDERVRQAALWTLTQMSDERAAGFLSELLRGRREAIERVMTWIAPM
jgi:hypothetical protein